jgi:predicted RNA-binding Zn ribbon-like protein
MAVQQDASGIDRLIAVLNSGGVGYEHGVDQMQDVERFDAFRMQLIASAGVKAGGESLPLARRLRDCLVALVSSAGADSEALIRLNQISKERSFQYVFDSHAGAVIEEQGGETLVGVTLRDLAQLRSEGKWNRIKICANPDCRAAYYDTTRARTQRWHSYATCGNKANVAAFRSRLS